MYLDFFNLNDKPFRITCDPKYLWLCEKHKEALAMLRYGILDNRGFLLLTGEVGTGKTLLVNQLLTLLPADTVVATLSDPDLSRIDFYRMVGHCFKLPSPIESKAAFLIQLREYLHDTEAKKQSVTLIIDEAQRLNHSLMEDIRALSNIELPDKKLINIFLIGQPELNQILSREENRALSQRITLRYHIEPLNREETAGYIHHRLEVAGNSDNFFKETALDKIFEYTAGIPRLINILCDHALLTGSVANVLQLDADIIVQCARELRIPTHKKSIGNFRYTSKSATSGHPIPKKKTTVEETKRLGRKSVDTQLKSSGVLKWAPLGIVLLLAISLMPALINMNDKSTLHGDNNDILNRHQGDVVGNANSSIDVNKDKTLTSQDHFEPEGADVKAVGPTMPPDETGAQDRKFSSEIVQDRSSPNSFESDATPEGAMNHPKELEPPRKAKNPNQFDQIRQIEKISPAEVDDVSGNRYLTDYNEDK